MYNQMTLSTTDRPRKSVKVDKEDYAAFSRFVKDQPSKGDAAINMGVSRFTIDRILKFKTAHPDTLEKIRRVCRQEVGTETGAR
jgi:hypothetical protein